jgi:DNA-directed RNA polymerase subunit RPC12/RpoP
MIRQCLDCTVTLNSRMPSGRCQPCGARKLMNERWARKRELYRPEVTL